MMLTVVTCDAAGERCSVWSNGVDREYLGAWQETELPSGLVPRGVAFDSGVEPQEPCVYVDP
jgi:hypothetical protein